MIWIIVAAAIGVWLFCKVVGPAQERAFVRSTYIDRRELRKLTRGKDGLYR